MRLHEDAVDLFQIDDAGLVTHGSDQRRHAEVFRSAQQSFAGAHDQSVRSGGEAQCVPAVNQYFITMHHGRKATEMH